MIEPHGGKLINRILPKKEALRILQDKTMPRLTVDRDTLLDLENIALGVYSPLSGFMIEEEFKSVVSKGRLLNNLVWTIPVFLALQSKNSKQLSLNSLALLCNEKNIVIGAIKVEDIYTVNKDKTAKDVFGTNDRKHPGVQKFYQMGDTFVGGEIWLKRRNAFPFHDFNLEPARVRKIIMQKKWKTIAGFQTRNIPHRAHEFLQKSALAEVDGLFIQPIIGWKKEGDFNPEMIIKTYQMLINEYFPKDRVVFSGLATAMRYAGPQEAIFHAIIRKNFGCTHFIVGRDHAGVGGFYDTYAAHRVFDKFPGLGITPILVRGPYYCKKCSSIVNDKICPHFNTKHKLEISGTTIRKMLTQNKSVPQQYLRKEVSDFIYKRRYKCLI